MIELLIAVNLLGAFDPADQAPVSQQIEFIRGIVMPNIVKFGGYAIVGAGAGLLIRSISGGR